MAKLKVFTKFFEFNRKTSNIFFSVHKLRAKCTFTNIFLYQGETVPLTEAPGEEPGQCRLTRVHVQQRGDSLRGQDCLQVRTEECFMRLTCSVSDACSDPVSLG